MLPSFQQKVHSRYSLVEVELAGNYLVKLQHSQGSGFGSNWCLRLTTRNRQGLEDKANLHSLFNASLPLLGLFLCWYCDHHIRRVVKLLELITAKLHIPARGFFILSQMMLAYISSSRSDTWYNGFHIQVVVYLLSMEPWAAGKNALS